MSKEQKLVYLGAGLIALGAFLPMVSFKEGEIISLIEFSIGPGIGVLVYSVVLGWAGYKEKYDWVASLGVMLFFPLLFFFFTAFWGSIWLYLAWPAPGAIILGVALTLFVGFRMYKLQKKN